MSIGLSAFFFSTLVRIAYPEHPANLMPILAYCTGVTTLVGAVFVRHVAYTPLRDVQTGSDLQHTDPPHPDHQGSALSKPDFLLLAVISGLCRAFNSDIVSGCGLMYINNVCSIC